MKKVREKVLFPVFDVMTVPEVLNRIAAEHEAEGYDVSRGPMGTVVLNFPDGEVHFVPDGRNIWEIAYAK